MTWKKYGVVLADPPWNFRTYSEKGTGRGAVAHYETMTFDDIARLPVLDYAAPDCALFLWVTDPMIPKALDLVKRWGFVYKTVGFYWTKTNKDGSLFRGMGYYTRANTEQCWIATRGKPRRLSRSVPRAVLSRRREHSRKPAEIRDAIMRLMPGPYLELFARDTQLGWDSMGDQVGLFDGGHVETRNRPSTLRGRKETGPVIAVEL